MQERLIIHLDVADFAAAVERVRDPGLCRRPLIVAPADAARARVYDMSEEAFQEGVRKGMPLSQARRRCRGAAVVPPALECYQRAMQAFLRQALPYSPLVEPAGEGHLYLDMTGTSRLWGSAEEAAWRLRRTVRRELRLDPVWSVAPNKLLAKVGTRTVKPGGECVVPAGRESSFLAPLPLQLLPGLAPGDLARLHEFNLIRVGELAALPPAQLALPFGRRARLLHELAHGIDRSPVVPGGQSKAISLDHEFAEDTGEPARIEAALRELAEEAGAELRRRRLLAMRLGLFLEYADAGRIVRQATALQPTAADSDLRQLARTALDRAWRRRIRLRRLRLVCDRLSRPSPQLSLFAAAAPRPTERLDAALDRIRASFGPESIGTGRRIAAISDQLSAKT